MKPSDTQVLTQLEFTPEDHTIAERIATRLGYTQTPYTSSSALWGCFCLPDNPEYVPKRGLGYNHRHACIIKTRELGFLVVQSTEDLGLTDDGRMDR